MGRGNLKRIASLHEPHTQEGRSLVPGMGGHGCEWLLPGGLWPHNPDLGLGWIATSFWLPSISLPGLSEAKTPRPGLKKLKATVTLLASF